jgi:sugar O-acyltransferase (sialic acid O-acetyltransferase NeuD family)
MNRLIIVGAGGHGKVIADCALKNGYTDISFVDDRATGTCMEFPIIGTTLDLEEMSDGTTDFVIGIGNNAIRKMVAEKHNINWVPIIHPSAQIGIHVAIGAGTVVMAGAIVNVCASVGRHCILNSNSVVEHDNVISDFVHISPGAKLGGTVHIGESTHIGIGATVSNNIDVCDHCVIGAGAVIVRDITVSGTYVGVPMRRIK